MPPEKRTKEYQCERCGEVFTSTMRLQHHKAAEHAPKTLKDIRTMKDMPHFTGSRL